MNNTKKHTPGPWQAVQVGNRAVVIDEKFGLPISEFYDRTNGQFHNEAYANAMVSAAAPELLEAAKDVCGLLFSLDNVPDDHPAYQALKEAIKKAQP